MAPESGPVERSGEGARFRAASAAGTKNSLAPPSRSLQTDVVRGIRWALVATVFGLIMVLAIRIWQGVPIGAAEQVTEKVKAPSESDNAIDSVPAASSGSHNVAPPALRSTPEATPKVVVPKPEPRLYPSNRGTDLPRPAVSAAVAPTPVAPREHATEPLPKPPVSSFAPAPATESKAAVQATPQEDNASPRNPVVRGIKSVGRVFGLGRKKEAKTSDAEAMHEPSKTSESH